MKQNDPPEVIFLQMPGKGPGGGRPGSTTRLSGLRLVGCPGRSAARDRSGLTVHRAARARRYPRRRGGRHGGVAFVLTRVPALGGRPSRVRRIRLHGAAQGRTPGMIRLKTTGGGSRDHPRVSREGRGRRATPGRQTARPHVHGRCPRGAGCVAYLPFGSSLRRHRSPAAPQTRSAQGPGG